jgi:hypothetical protein
MLLSAPEVSCVSVVSWRQEFEAVLWRAPGKAAWCFLTLPEETSARIRTLTRGLRNPFGSLRVSARIGRTEWKTSLFADTKANAYLLPVKADVRKQERLAAGDLVAVEITVNP